MSTTEEDAAERARLKIDASEHQLRRWAQRLHDEPQQGIGAVRMRLAASRRASDATLRAAVDDAIDQLAIEIGVLRSLISELRPAALDELGLETALRGLADLHAGLEIETEISLGDHTRDAGLDAEIQSTIFRAVQEALANAAGHARARRVLVDVSPAVGGLVLNVTDDGIGFDPERHPYGVGLCRLGERIELLGGSMRVKSAPGAGTTLRVRLPLGR